MTHTHSTEAAVTNQPHIFLFPSLLAHTYSKTRKELLYSHIFPSAGSMIQEKVLWILRTHCVSVCVCICSVHLFCLIKIQGKLSQDLCKFTKATGIIIHYNSLIFLKIILKISVEISCFSHRLCKNQTLLLCSFV